MKTIKNIFNFSAAVVFAYVITACSSAKVSSDMDSSFPFDKANSYAINTEYDSVMTSIQKSRVSSSIEKQMNSRGFSESESPDIMIYVATATEQKKDVSVNHSSYGTGYYGGGRYRYGYGGGGFTTGTSNVNVNEYTEGTVVVTMIDTDRNQLIWVGSVSGTMKENKSKKDATVDKAMSKMFKSFPVDQTKS